MKYEEAKPYLKEGMTIKIIGGDTPYWSSYRGKIFKVRLVNGNDCFFGEDKKTGVLNKPYEELEILTDEHGNPWCFPDKQTFKVGDRVRMKRGSFNVNSFEGEAIYRGQSEASARCIALELLTERKCGSAQNGWWNYIKEDLDDMEKLSPSDEPKPEKKFMNITPDFFIETQFYPFPDFSQQETIRRIDEYVSQQFTKPLTKKPTIMSKAITFVKNQALKATNPDEFELREAGLHNDCGELTSEGESLHMELLRDLTREKMVGIAKEMNAEKKESK
jgi:hypothetical protein